MKWHEQREAPKFAIKLLRLICHPDFKEEIEGDVLERYNGDLLKYGYKVARKNIWWQVFLLTKPNLIFNLTRNNMKNIFNPKENPQGMLAIAALVLLLLITTTVVLDFDFADKTMFTVPMSAIVWFIPVLLLLFWIVYITTSKLLYSKVLTRIHVLTTVGVTMAIVVTAFIAAKPHQSAINNYELMGTITQILVLTFVLIQIAYISNLVIGLVSRFGKSAKQTK